MKPHAPHGAELSRRDAPRWITTSMTYHAPGLTAALLAVALLAGCPSRHAPPTMAVKPDTGTPATATRPSHISALLRSLPSLSGVRDRVAQLDSRLKTTMVSATPKERALLKRFKAEALPLWRKARPTRADLARGLELSMALARGMAALHPDDEEVQVIVAASLAMAGRSAEALELDGAAYQPEALRLSRALITRFPRSARAHAQLGHVLALAQGDNGLEAMRHYGRCLELDPTSTRCRANLKMLATDHSRPRCVGVDIEPTIALYRTSRHPAPGAQKSLPHNGQTLYLVGQPLLSAGDIANIIGDGRNASISLSPTATKRLAAETAALTLRAGVQVALVAHNKVLMAPRLREAIPDGRLAVFAGASGTALLNQLCVQVRRPQLPAKLRKR